MECSRFIEEKVGQSESPEFLRHLAMCGGCQRDVEEMDEIRAFYRASSVERYKGGVPSLRRFGWAAWLSSAAAAAAMIAALVFLMLPRVAPPVPSDSLPPAHAFIRIPMEPWRGDVRFDRVLDDCWRQLDTLERSR
jgi:hypothetical protein